MPPKSVAKFSAKNRTVSHLNAKLDHRLLAYAAAATAAGVGILALSAPADAEIVYTPKYQVLKSDDGYLYLDLNNDGINDFYLSNAYATSVFARGRGGAFPTGNTSRAAGYLVVIGSHPSNRAVAAKGGYASNLEAGVKVGAAHQFNLGEHEGLMAGCDDIGGEPATLSGLWRNVVQNHYLGLRFLIDGQVHYGWARLSVTRNRCDLTAALTGYAYETEANTAIITGQTSGNDEADVDTKQAGTLGALARGAR